MKSIHIFEKAPKMKKIYLLLLIYFLVFVGCQSTPVQPSEAEIKLFQARADSTVSLYDNLLDLTEEQKIQIRPIVDQDLMWQMNMRNQIENQRKIMEGERQLMQTKREMGQRGGRMPKGIRSSPMEDGQYFVDRNKMSNKERLKYLEQELSKILTVEQMETLREMHRVNIGERR